MLEASARRQTRILLVEDDADLRGALMEFLQSEGYQVEGAANGVEALEHLRSKGVPDLILLDLMMPVMDGWQFRVEQKRDPALAATPVVVFSGDDSAKAEAVDANHYLKKPFDEQTLLESIELTIRTATRPADRAGGDKRSRSHLAPSSGASLEERLIGQVLPGELHVLRKIGGGGMGLVYEAERGDGGDRVAVKILSTQLASRPEVVQRFTNEARAVAMLHHPNIVNALEIGCTEQGLPFFVLELLEGSTLEGELRTNGPMAIGRAVRIARQLASALAAAHDHGIVHRDMKPANVFLSRDEAGADQAKVLDFGVSKFQNPWSGSSTKTGELLGTPNYMAPEQLSDARAVDQRTDVYGLSATIYEMLTGRPPFGGDNFPVLFLKIMTDPPPSLREQRPDLPDDLIAAIEKGLAKSSDSRWRTVDELADALAPFESIDRPVLHVPFQDAAAPPPVSVVDPRSTVRPGRRTRLLMLAAVVGVLLAGAGLYLKSQRTTRELLAAERRETTPAPSVLLEVSSPLPQAQLRWRGTLHPLPFAAPVKSSHAREPLEVLAPGHQGRRFWLVLDRPRRLQVNLPAGRGVRDADDDEVERAIVPPPADR